MTADGDSVSKHTPLHPVHLDEQMSVTQLVQRLEALHFDSHEEARLMIDPGVQAFLIRATKAAAADHLDAKVSPRVARDQAAIASPLPAALVRRANRTTTSCETLKAIRLSTSPCIKAGRCGVTARAVRDSFGGTQSLSSSVPRLLKNT
jgi:hypothetical protein